MGKGVKKFTLYYDYLEGNETKSWVVRESVTIGEIITDEDESSLVRWYGGRKEEIVHNEDKGANEANIRDGVVNQETRDARKGRIIMKNSYDQLAPHFTDDGIWDARKIRLDGI